MTILETRTQSEEASGFINTCTGLWRAPDGYFVVWSVPGWKCYCWLLCPCSSFRIPSYWNSSYFLFLFLFLPSSIQIFTYTCYMLHKNRWCHCKTKLNEKAYGLFSIVVYIYLLYFDTHCQKFSCFFLKHEGLRHKIRTILIIWI